MGLFSLFHKKKEKEAGQRAADMEEVEENESFAEDGDFEENEEFAEEEDFAEDEEFAEEEDFEEDEEFAEPEEDLTDDENFEEPTESDTEDVTVEESAEGNVDYESPEAEAEESFEDPEEETFEASEDETFESPEAETREASCEGETSEDELPEDQTSEDEFSEQAPFAPTQPWPDERDTWQNADPAYGRMYAPQDRGGEEFNQENGRGEDNEKADKDSIGAGTIFLITLTAAMIGGLLGAWFLIFGVRIARGFGLTGTTTSYLFEGTREKTTLKTSQVDTSTVLSAADLYELNVGSTVGIVTQITTTGYWGSTATGTASGSGFILTEDGYIVTNYHVIEGANSVMVSMYGGQSWYADICGYDKNNDVAVLKVDATGLTPVVLGDSDNLRVGEDVVAIGNPLGELPFSLTQGSISALNRSIHLKNGTNMDLIQTDTAINSGNSGGALFNMYGEVIGITNAKFSTNIYSSDASIDNIGFAIPMNSVRDIIANIIEKGYIVKPFLGVTVQSYQATKENGQILYGAKVISIEKDGPAAKVGILPGDIITYLNGTMVHTSTELVKLVGARKSGEEVSVTLLRGGREMKIQVVLGERHQSAFEDAETTASSEEETQEAQETQPGIGREDYDSSEDFSGEFSGEAEDEPETEAQGNRPNRRGSEETAPAGPWY